MVGWGWMGGGTTRTEGLKFKVLGSLFEVGCFSGVMHLVQLIISNYSF